MAMTGAEKLTVALFCCAVCAFFCTQDIVAIAEPTGMWLPTAISVSFYPALYTAAKHGREKEVRRLLDAGADVDGRSGADRSTALHIAAFEGFEAVALLLIERGANMSATDEYGGTPLHWSVSPLSRNHCLCCRPV